jgi:hypothetical protein
MAKRMPPDIRERVARAVLRRADLAGWEDLNARERSAYYNAWTTDVEVGGVIAQYLPAEAIRVWIKDGPMKEYTRARRGLGPYAGLVRTTTEREIEILFRSLGEGWSLAPGSIAVKPARFVAEDATGNRIDIIWGSPSDLKHLVWAWLNQPSDRETELVIATSTSQPMTRDERARVSDIGRKLSATIRVLD